MKMSGVAPIKGGRKKSQRTRVQPCTHPSWTENKLENEERGETTDTQGEIEADLRDQTHFGKRLTRSTNSAVNLYFVQSELNFQNFVNSLQIEVQKCFDKFRQKVGERSVKK